MKKILKILIISLLLVTSVTGCIKPSEDQVREKMEKALLKEYGEEFVVENIGLRDANGEKFYQASIYPKSIIGTPKENDNYYRAEAVVDLKRFYAENSVGDTYGEIKMNDEAEEFLLPKAKELFGEKVRLKSDIKYEVLQENDFYSQYFVSGFIDKRDKVLNNPKTQRLVLELKIFIFDKIDNKEEEETRKKQLFEFLQYLRKEKLDKYLSIDCDFMDDIVLAPSFEENRYILEKTEDKKEKKEIENKLREEVKKLSEKEFLDNMNGILKSEFDYEFGHLGSKFVASFSLIRTLDYLKEILPDEYSKIDTTEKIKKHQYTTSNDFTSYEKKNYIFRKEVE